MNSQYREPLSACTTGMGEVRQGIEQEIEMLQGIPEDLFSNFLVSTTFPASL